MLHQSLDSHTLRHAARSGRSNATASKRAWKASTSIVRGPVAPARPLPTATLPHPTIARAVEAPPAPATTSSGPAPQVSPSPAPSTPFPWTEHWYPVAAVADLDPKRPQAMHLLGIPLVLWRDGAGEWRAMEDKCPHRLAPLSEGRLESDGTLQCAYHGWTFNGQGACTRIPQLKGDDKAQQVACSSKRSCVRSFPTQQRHGLLWVLPDASERGRQLAASNPTPSGDIPTLKEGWHRTNWFVRDLPVRYDTLMENVLDPSHVPFSHHGVQGDRNKAGKMSMTVTDSGPGGFATVMEGGFNTKITVKMPALASYGDDTFTIFAIPTRPGWSRVIVANSWDKKAKSSLVFKVIRTILATDWLGHVIQRNQVLDGDSYFLHVQERLLNKRAMDWQSAYFMPSPADAAVIALRRWLDAYGYPPTCEPDTMPPELTKREALDRFSQHTQHCNTCKRTLRICEVGSVLAGLASALCVLWPLAQLAAGQPPALPFLAAAAALGLAVAALRKFRQQLIFVDYVHADK